MYSYKTLKSILKRENLINDNMTYSYIINLIKNTGIVIKTFDEYKKEWIDDAAIPNGSHAFLAESDDGYIIYHDDDYYKNYWIIHEFSHYMLKHNHDGEIQEYSANLMSCMIIAPVKSLINNKIFTPYEIHKKYCIPEDIAVTYFNELIKNENKYSNNVNNKTFKSKLIKNYKKALLLFSIFTILILSFTLNKNIQNSKKDSLIKIMFSAETVSVTTFNSFKINMDKNTETEKTEENITVYITKTGKKYHRASCQYVKNKVTVFTLSLENAKLSGYTPCSKCLP